MSQDGSSLQRSHLSLKNILKCDKEAISLTTQAGKYKNLGNCLLLVENHLSGIHSKFLKSV